MKKTVAGVLGGLLVGGAIAFFALNSMSGGMVEEGQTTYTTDEKARAHVKEFLEALDPGLNVTVEAKSE